MIAIVHSIYSQSVHAPALDAGLMDNDAERYCTLKGEWEWSMSVGNRERGGGGEGGRGCRAF